jgi:hypothetical protein
MTARQVTQLPQEAREGDKSASAQLIELAYAELHRLASRYLSGECSAHPANNGAGERNLHAAIRLRRAAEAEQPRALFCCGRHTHKRDGIQIELMRLFIWRWKRTPKLWRWTTRS